MVLEGEEFEAIPSPNARNAKPLATFPTASDGPITLLALVTHPRLRNRDFWLRSVGLGRRRKRLRLRRFERFFVVDFETFIQSHKRLLDLLSAPGFPVE